MSWRQRTRSREWSASRRVIRRCCSTRSATPVAPGTSRPRSRPGSTPRRSPSCSRRWRRCSSSSAMRSHWTRPSPRYLGLEETGISSAVTPYHLLTHTSGHRRRRRRGGGRAVRGRLPRATQLLGHRDGGLPSAVRRQAAELRAWRGLPVLQRRLRVARAHDRAGYRLKLPRVRVRACLRPGRDEPIGVLPYERRRAGGRRRRRGDRERGWSCRRVAPQHLLIPSDRRAGRRRTRHHR